MQISKISNTQNQSTYTSKVKNKTGTFKDTLAMREKEEVQYERLKVRGDGKLQGFTNGIWQNINENFNPIPCGPNEILVIAEGFVQIGHNLIIDGILCGGLDKTPFAIQEDMGFSYMKNSLALVPGTTVDLPDGTILKWTRNGVDFVPRKAKNLREEAIFHKNAAEIAFMMNEFTRVANRQALGVGRSIGIAKDKVQDIKTVLSEMGINTNDEFYVNGKKFIFDTSSGEFKYTLESSVDGKYVVKYAQGAKIKLAK